ncbi:MAG: flagellar filament capping protein FliD, partial [Bryobacteraceae bacterium]
MSSSSITSSLSTLVTPLNLSGTSQYTSDFQSILNRQVQIASLPLQFLQSQDTTVLAQQTALGGFVSPVNALANAVTALGTLAANQALTASSSDSSVVTAQATGATNPGTYTIDTVSSIAAAASESSASGYADSTTTQVSSTGTLQLVVGSNTYAISLTPDTNNLLGLQNAINSLGAGVTASILTTGTGANPNYLSISANSTGATTLQLFDDPTGAHTNLLTSNNQGSDASFNLNGLPVTSHTNTVNNVIPGLTFTIVAPTTGSEKVTLSLASDSSQLINGIQ